MKIIELQSPTHGKHQALIDDDDFEKVSSFNWCILLVYDNLYAHGRSKGKTIFMHRLIMGCQKGDGICIDHIDRNGLNNQKNNLRKSTRSENMANMSPQKGTSSPYKGVKLRIRRNKAPKFFAQIQVNKKSIHLGCFPHTAEGEIGAARAYDEAAKEYFGEFAYLNFK